MSTPAHPLPNELPLPKDAITESFSARLGRYIPEWAVPALAAAKKYAVDPLNRMAEAGATFGGNAAEEMFASVMHPETTTAPVLPSMRANATGKISGFTYDPNLIQHTEQEHPVASGIVRSVGENVGEGVADPRMWALGLGEIGSATLSRILSAGFSLQQVYSVASSVPGITKAIKDGRIEDATQLITNAGIGTGLSGVAGIHAVEKMSPNTIVSASGREMQLPPERTTGVPESDEAIRKGGAIPGGKLEKVGKMEHDIHLFHDPQTGSTLALPADKINRESVAKHMEESRAKFAAGKNKLAEVPGSIEVAPSEISKTSHATLGPIPQSLKGSNPNISDESIFGHEYGHAAHGLLNGGTVKEIGSHWHPTSMEIGAAAHTRVTFPAQGAKTFSEWIAKDPSNLMTALQHSLAGPITQEVVYGVPIRENPGVAGDMQEIRGILSSLGLTPEQAKDTINYLANGWRNKLTEKNPLTGDTLGDIIKKYAPRNEDIGEEYLASPEKLRNFAQEVYKHESQLREGNNRGNGGGVSTATEGQRTENAARPKGKPAPINIERSLQTIPGAVEVKPKS